VIEARFQGGNEEWREKIASVEKFEELCEQLNLDVVFFKTAVITTLSFVHFSKRVRQLDK